MEVSKIHLSPTELDLVQNAEIILTKNTIIKKAIALLGRLQDAITEQTGHTSSEIYSVSPKISKGENYQGLPYAVLDYPRVSRGNDLCFIRSLFWWGHFFSSTLQLSGAYTQLHKTTILSSYKMLSEEQYYISINPDPWQHHFEKSNYSELNALTIDEFEMILSKQDHIKIAAKWPLQEWHLAAIRLYNSWNLLTGLIT